VELPHGAADLPGEQRVKQHVIHQSRWVVMDSAGPERSNRSTAGLANTSSANRSRQRLLLEQHNSPRKKVEHCYLRTSKVSNA
jgi:hypothetical protein